MLGCDQKKMGDRRFLKDIWTILMFPRFVSTTAKYLTHSSLTQGSIPTAVRTLNRTRDCRMSRHPEVPDIVFLRDVARLAGKQGWNRVSAHSTDEYAQK